SRPDRVVDLELSREQRSGNDEALQALRPPGKGLLLIYPVSKDSEPLRGESRRIPLDALEDVIGVGMVFPGVPPSRGWSEVDYVAIDITAAGEPEHEEELEEEDAKEELERVLAEDDEDDYVVPGDILERT